MERYTCYGCGKPHTTEIVRDDLTGEMVEVIRDGYDFCDECRAIIPDYATISRDDRITAAMSEEAMAWGTVEWNREREP